LNENGSVQAATSCFHFCRWAAAWPIWRPKSWVFAWLGAPRQGRTWWLIEDICGFQTSLNEGALFGMGQGKVWLFASLSVVAAVAIVYWLFVAGAARRPAVDHVAGDGDGGHLRQSLRPARPVDDARQAGQRFTPSATSFLFQYQNWVWPNFNVADSLLVCGAALLVWHAYRSERKQPAGETNMGQV